MKNLLLILACVFLWNCSNCGYKQSYYILIEKDAKIVSYDSTFVNHAYFTSGSFDLDSAGYTEHYYNGINVYLDSNSYGLSVPKHVTGSIFKRQEEIPIDSANLETRMTNPGVGIFVEQRFIGDETRLKLFINRSDDPADTLTLNFEIKQEKWKTRRSHCLDAFLRL